MRGDQDILTLLNQRFDIFAVIRANAVFDNVLQAFPAWRGDVVRTAPDMHLIIAILGPGFVLIKAR